MKPLVKLVKKQGHAFRLLLDNVTEFILFGGGANGGKSWLGCVWLLVMCYAYPGTRWFIGREELKRLRNTTLITYFKVCKAYDIPRADWNYNGQDHFIEFTNGSRIDLLDLKYLPSDPLFERYGSAEYTGGWIEEGGETVFAAFDVLKSRVGRHLNDKYGILGKILISCNPKKNWLYRLFYKPWRDGTLPPNYAFVQSLVTDNVFREKDSITKLDGLTDRAMRERLRHGNWNYEDAPDQLIRYEWIEACRNAPVVKGKKCLGVDVAWYGDDASAIACMRGNVLPGIKSYHNLSPDLLADEVSRIAGLEHIDADHIGVDGVGLGGGVVAILRRSGMNIEDIQSGSTKFYFEPTEEYNFANLRSLMWWLLREDIRLCRVRIEEDDKQIEDLLIEDLTAPKYEIKGGREIHVESKDTIKTRIGRSTDLGDSAVYANYIRNLRGHEQPQKILTPADVGVYLP